MIVQTSCSDLPQGGQRPPARLLVEIVDTGLLEAREVRDVARREDKARQAGEPLIRRAQDAHFPLRRGAPPLLPLSPPPVYHPPSPATSARNRAAFSTA